MISKILRKYNASRDMYYQPGEAPYANPKTRNASPQPEADLMEKWAGHIGAGWYGFAIGRPCPDSWFKIIDEFLDYLLTLDPDFQIHQIKMKYGGICFYVQYSIADPELSEFVEMQIEKLEDTLYDKKLVY